MGLQSKQPRALGRRSLAAVREDRRSVTGRRRFAGVTHHCCATSGGVFHEQVVQSVTAESECGLPQPPVLALRAEVQVYLFQRRGMRLCELRPDSEALQQWRNFRRQKFTADFMPRKSGFFKQPDQRAILRCRYGCGGTGRPCADNVNLSQSPEETALPSRFRVSASPAVARLLSGY